MGLLTLLRGAAKLPGPAARTSETSSTKPPRSATSPREAAGEEGAQPARFVTDLALTKLTGDWALDPTHSMVGFAARHALVTRVRGNFAEFEGRMRIDPERLDLCSADVVIQVGSIDTRVEQRDAHLRSPDFFDVDRFPEMRFRSTGVEQSGQERYRMTGDLSIRDRTHPVDIDLVFGGSVVDAFGVERIGLDGTAYVNRTDWGLTWNAALETGGMMVSDQIKLEFDLSAVRVA